MIYKKKWQSMKITSRDQHIYRGVCLHVQMNLNNLFLCFIAMPLYSLSV
jgi:hypothetical protein